MSLTTDFLAAGRAHDRDFERDHAPFNRPDGFEEFIPVRCDECGVFLSDAERVACDGWSENKCDGCTVKQAQWFGIWDETDKSALARLNAKA